MKEAAGPIIGIASRSINSEDNTGAAFAVLSSYVRAVIQSGGIPVLIPPHSIEALRILDGVLLTGGEDISDRKYWATGQPLEPLDHGRDIAEFELARETVNLGVPILGICRGAQILNCMFGGNIERISESHFGFHSGVKSGDGNCHIVEVDQSTNLGAFCEEDTLFVRSRHAVKISRLGNNLRKAAWSTDGQIEAFEGLRKTLLGVMWHPEWPPDEVHPHPSVLTWLVQHARKARSS